MLFKKLQSSAEQLTSIERWHRILSVAFMKYLKGRILKPPDLITQTCQRRKNINFYMPKIQKKHWKGNGQLHLRLLVTN